MELIASLQAESDNNAHLLRHLRGGWLHCATETPDYLAEHEAKLKRPFC
jgi:hypothetical protein